MRTKFTEVWPRTQVREMMLLSLGLPTGPLALVQLYLTTGRSAPPDHALGCMFGFCNAEGEFVPRTAATHVGWTLATETKAGADAECLEHITRVHAQAQVEATHACCGCNGGRRSCGREPCPFASPARASLAWSVGPLTLALSSCS